MTNSHNVQFSLRLLVVFYVVTVSQVSSFTTTTTTTTTTDIAPSWCYEAKTKIPFLLRSAIDDDATISAPSAIGGAAPSLPPHLNGNRVIPMRVMLPGLQSHNDDIAAVYAVLTSGYTKSDPDAEWSKVKFVGSTTNLYEALRSHLNDEGSDKVAHVRAMAMTDSTQMNDVVVEWKTKAVMAGSKLADWMTPEILQRRISTSLRAEEEEDGVISSPFETNDGSATTTTTTKKMLKFNRETIDKVLEEVRPYLIQDGGNVSVQKVNVVESSKQVHLKLEGACGSCASSTVTMSMGIEKVLKENFGTDIEIVLVEDDNGNMGLAATELTREAIEEELKRIMPAMVAMGAKLEIVTVQSETGTVEIQFEGSTKVRQGLELALLDVLYCNHVNFV